MASPCLCTQTTTYIKEEEKHLSEHSNELKRQKKKNDILKNTIIIYFTN